MNTFYSRIGPPTKHLPHYYYTNIIHLLITLIVLSSSLFSLSNSQQYYFASQTFSAQTGYNYNELPTGIVSLDPHYLSRLLYRPLNLGRYILYKSIFETAKTFLYLWIELIVFNLIILLLIIGFVLTVDSEWYNPWLAADGSLISYARSVGRSTDKLILHDYRFSIPEGL